MKELGVNDKRKTALSTAEIPRNGKNITRGSSLKIKLRSLPDWQLELLLFVTDLTTYDLVTHQQTYCRNCLSSWWEFYLMTRLPLFPFLIKSLRNIYMIFSFPQKLSYHEFDFFFP